MAETRPGTPTPAQPAKPKRERKPRDPNAPISLDVALKRYDKALAALNEARETVKKVSADQLAKINAAVNL
jgi:hypothetical protein